MKYLLFVLLVLAVACTAEISKETAQSTALEFVKANVKFYTDPNDDTGNVTSIGDYRFEAADSYQTETDFHFVYRVVADVADDTKEANIKIAVNKKSGQVSEFNGRKI